ncbi:MAG TPA: TIGR03013 family PEP-CTERM/XrtA system glycosyltransferase [Deltaproteobacteria bacterium]|nr:TIGR03013 family PEP-CTERM/XrtA system glycosyltransferase [Deltaproteobacteria bacterium]
MFYFLNRYLSKRTLMVWASESILLYLIALSLTATMDGYGYLAVDFHPLAALAVASVYGVVYYYFDLYAREHHSRPSVLFRRLAAATLTAAAGEALLRLAAGYQIYTVPLDAVLIATAVCLWRAFLARHLEFDVGKGRVMIIGTGDLARKIGSEIYGDKDHDLELVGFIDDDPEKIGHSIVNPGVIGGYGDIARLAETEGVDRIIVALADRRSKLPMSALLDCKLKGVSIEEGETFQERMMGKIPLDQLKPSWLVFSDGFKSLRSRKIIKRVLDMVFSFVLLVAALPVMALTAVAIKLESRGPVIFRQTRVGENGRHFEIYKFRSMRQDAESKTGPVWAREKDDRVTRVGAFIRKTRIDELPQLINVLRGDMSFVGPRPERPYFVDQLKEVIPYYEIRTAVKPGVTGWAQIKYPYGATFKDALEKLQYDLYYIKNMSPLFDVIIFFRTIKVVLSRKGAR